MNHLKRLRAERHRDLRWRSHPNIKLKGFAGAYVLWSLDEVTHDGDRWEAGQAKNRGHAGGGRPLPSWAVVSEKELEPKKARKHLAMSVIVLAVALIFSVTILWAALSARGWISGPKPLKIGDTFSDCSSCPVMTVLSSGKFTMGFDGSETNKAETPAHDVIIRKSFAVSKFEITNGQYAEFLTAMLREEKYDQRYVLTNQGANGNPLLFRLRHYEVSPGFEKHPVTGVSWQGAQAYVRWLSSQTEDEYRLLTEAEWEYAARAGTTTKYYFGDEILKICEHGNIPDRSRLEKHSDWVVFRCTDGYSETAPVGSFAPNPFGLYDMLGNAWEWVEDCMHDNYDGAPTDGSAWLTGASCSTRVVRGGSYDVFPGSGLGRAQSEANNRIKSIGFRVARNVTISQ
jgi:formylglycine-generating enzyme required for sulfatase activity